MSRLVLNPFTVFPNVTINTSQVSSFGTRGPVVTIVDTAPAPTAASLEITLQLPDEALLHRAKPARPGVAKKWAHAFESKYPELSNKSDAELSAIIRRMRER